MSSKKKDPPEPMEEKELPAEENEKEKEAEAPAAEAPKDEPKVEKEPEKPAEPSADALLKAEKDRYLRLLAEYDNYRKRSSKERESIYQDVRADTVTKFLPVYDNLVRALDQATCDEAYRKGVEMIMTQLRDILSRMGVTEIESLGQKFDPALHNAVMHFLAVAQAGGVLEVRDNVDELRVVLGEDLFQLVAVDAVLVQADGADLRAVEVEGLESGEIAGLLNGDGVTRVDERRGNHVQRLLGAVGDDDVLGRKVYALLLIAVGDELAQRQIALGVAVLQGAHTVTLKDLRDRGLHLLYRKGVGVRKSAGKGYYVRGCGGLEYGSGEFALKIGLGHAFRDPELHFLFLLLAT